jgi:hypothetical protein
MRWLRILAGLAIVAALGLAAAESSCVTRTFPASIPCNASALAAPYNGPLKVDSVASFGCVGGWAYLWATIGKGVEEVGVTEVLHYDSAKKEWKNASRLTYCGHHLLPDYVQYWGCNSN